MKTRDDEGLVIRMHDRAYVGRNGRSRIERAVGGVSCALLLTIMLAWGVGVPRVQADEGSAPADYGKIPEKFLTEASFNSDVTTAGSPSMLDYILEHYNLFVEEEATAGHVVGPVVIGGDYHNQISQVWDSQASICIQRQRTCVELGRILRPVSPLVNSSCHCIWARTIFEESLGPMIGGIKSPPVCQAKNRCSKTRQTTIPRLSCLS